MGKYITPREPLTEAEILEYLNREVERAVKHWGENSYWAESEMKHRDKTIERWHNGEVVMVHSEEYVDSYGNGCGSYADELYSDGTVKTACYGFLD